MTSVAVVTGAGSGIGRASAIKLAEAGFAAKRCKRTRISRRPRVVAETDI